MENLATEILVGDWLVRPRLNQIVSGDRTVHLEPRTMDLLVFLARHPGEVLSKEDFLREVWKGMAVTDEVLTNSIWELRRAFGDRAKEPRYIQTIHRKGYRLIAPVSPASGLGPGEEAPPPPPPPGPPSPAPDPLPEPRRRHANILLWVALLLGGMVSALLLTRGAWGPARTGAASASPDRPVSLAVLPLVNLSGDPEKEYFADGMTDELITSLAKIRSLRVISRTSVMRYKGTRKPVPEIARELRVDHVLEGSVALAGDRVRITAQLIEGETDHHLWAESYETDLSDVLRLQGEVAQAIAGEIRGRLTSEEKAGLRNRTEVDPEAFQLYLKAAYHLNRRSPEAVRKALGLLEAASREDPGFALAYVGRSNAYSLQGFFGALPRDQAISRAKTAALKALAIDPSLAEGYAALGFVKHFDWDWSGASAEYRRAIDLHPGYATVRHWYANQLAILGDLERARAEIRRAQELDPLSASINSAAGLILFFSRDYDAAMAELEATIDLEPDFGLAHIALGEVYVEKGMYPEALREMRRAAQILQSGDALAMLAYAHAAAGETQEALSILRRIDGPSATKPAHPGTLATLYGRLNDMDNGFRCLERVWRERDLWGVFLKVDPTYDPLRGDARFTEILRKMGLEP